MKRKQIIEIIIGCLFLLGIALFYDLSRKEEPTSSIDLRDLGEGSSEIELIVEGSSMKEALAYELEVGERRISEQEASDLFSQAEEEIMSTVFYEGEDINHVYTGLLLREKYVNKKVRASWEFDQWEMIDEEGKLLRESLPKSGELITVEVTLRVSDYTQEYMFTFQAYRAAVSKEDEFLADVKDAVNSNIEDSVIRLPEEVGGQSLRWRVKQDKVFIKILMLEITTGILLWYLVKKKKEQGLEHKRRQMQFDYSEIVSKYAILLGAGMSTKQIWYSISASYINKKQKRTTKKRYIYEEIQKTYYELLDGEYESEAYLKFGKRVQLPSYNRFVRLLNQSNTKGSRGVFGLLKTEASMAFAERVAVAKTLGEEASTKLLFPLVLMMGVLMMIIIAPAFVEFIS